MINRFFLGFIGIVFLISCNNYAGSENLATKPDVQQVTAPSEIDSINGEIKKQPNNDLLYQNRAKLLVVEERFEEAQNDLERAIESARSSDEPYVMLVEKGRFEPFANSYAPNGAVMSREQAINLVRLYDGSYPENFVDLYLDYYQMSRTEFDSVIDKWVNPDLFKKENGRWKPTFTIK